MACAVAIGSLCVVGTRNGIREPVVGVFIRAEGVAGMFFEEGRCCRPERGYGFGVIVDIYSETIGLVMLGHELENVVLNVAEIPVVQQKVKLRQRHRSKPRDNVLDIWLHAPVVLIFIQSRMPKKEARIPTTHFMVTQLSCVHDPVVGHILESFLHPRLVDPIWHIPMLLRYEFYKILVFLGD